MRYLPKILLIYSLLFSVALVLLGLVTSRSNSQALFPLLFVPVVVFLVLNTINKNNTQAPSAEQSKEIWVFGVIFVLLMTVGISNVRSSNAKQIENPESSKSPLIIQISENTKNNLGKVRINVADKTYADVFESTQSGSNSFAKVYNGEIVEYSSKQDGWYEVILSDDLRGYLQSEYAVEVDQ